MVPTRRVLAAALSVFLFAAPSVVKDPRHKAAHRIQFVGKEGHSFCSGTSVSDHVLISAQHCLVPELQGIKVDSDDSLHRVDRLVKDDHDTLLIVLVDRPFRAWVFLERSQYYRTPEQGEKAYWWGNPSGIADQYRAGYVSGYTDSPDHSITSDPVYMVAAPAVPGDSGSSIYGEDGRLLGVLTYGVFGGLFAGFFSPHFTDAQMAEAGL